MFAVVLLLVAIESFSQCNALRPQIDVSFNTDQDCAPVSVTQFQVTYYFNVPQDPASIQVLYQWNDPANSSTIIGTGNGLIVAASASGANTSFTANATFLYTDNNNQCNITPTTYVVINGAICFSSQEVKTAFYWDKDNEGNGVVQMDPADWEVCYNDAVINAVFSDASEFNCNISVEPDNPNRSTRYVQFIYGTNHNAAASIRDLTLNDGATRGLTDGTGDLAASDTRGTGAVQITGAYFGPVDEVPFPADGPVSVTYPMNAPASAANEVGDRFEVTMVNWNICNPWNGDPVNPNYEDAVLTTAFIVIVPAPQPAFFTTDAEGNPATEFCIGEPVSFVNSTPDVAGNSYTWEFFDDATGDDLIEVSTVQNTVLTFSSGGQKMVRLTATNPTAQSACVAEYVSFVNITPSMVAVIGVSDLDDMPVETDFCQESDGATTSFDVRFRDLSTGTPVASTERRWEFFDENNTLILESPSGGGFAPGVAGPFDRVFVDPGIYLVRLRIRDNATGCESVDEVSVRVFLKPDADFSFDRVCETSATTFEDLSTVTSIMGEQIVSREWDMSYDGVTFSKDPSLDNQRNFSYVFPAAGTYTVALRVVTDQGNCAGFISRNVTVDAIPAAAFMADVSSGCSALTVNFTNNAIDGQPDVISEYHWEVDAGPGFQLDSIQRPSDPGFSNLYSRDFVNDGSTDRQYQVRLRVITVNGCESVSDPETITVFASPRSGFSSTDYSPFNENCSPVPVSFSADAATQSANPTDYQWTIRDSNGIISSESTGTTPTYDFTFVNSTQALQDFFITLHATLPGGCSSDSTRVIRVSPVPASDFTVDTLSVTCDRITFHVSATQKGLKEYEWTITSNGVTLLASSGLGDEFDYDIDRSATVDQQVEFTLVTSNFANCSSSETAHRVGVGPREDIDAAFAVTPSTQRFPAATVTITNNTNPGAWDYFWDFGDGSTASGPSVTEHTYASPGTYTITLVVSGEHCSETRTATVAIMPPPPSLAFDFDPPSGCVPLTVSFTNQSLFADPTTYRWDFGDGSPVSAQVDPVHTYSQAGVYSVTLTASNEQGESAELKKESIIEVYESPLAQFNVKPREIPFPGGKLYTDNQSFAATSYLWDFGDGTTSTDFEPEHVYQTEGVFTISLIASNTAGCADTLVMDAGVRTILSGQMLIPNAFSPNILGPGASGGQNDTFLPVLRGVTEFQMLVFNRWGELLFETTNAEQGWDGYYQGKLCQQDVYVYKITAKYGDGHTITRVGDIHLMR